MLKGMKYSLGVFLMLMPFSSTASSAPFQQLPQEINWEILQNILNKNYYEIGPDIQNLRLTNLRNRTFIDQNTEKLINILSKRTGNNKARAAKIIGTQTAQNIAKNQYSNDYNNIKNDEEFLGYLIKSFNNMILQIAISSNNKIKEFQARISSNNLDYNDEAYKEIKKLLSEGVFITTISIKRLIKSLIGNIENEDKNSKNYYQGMEIINLLQETLK